MSLTEKQFIIGIGSQRAGSTLLFSILDNATAIYMHPVKELHYFDTLYNIRPLQTLREYSQKNLEREILNLNEKSCKFLHSKLYQNYLHTNYQLSFIDINHISYIDLYRPCLLGNTHLGEITPEYMLLPEEGILHLKNTVGENAKIILIMREPIQRTLSALKLLNVYQGLQLDENGISTLLNDFIENNSNWLQIQDEFNKYEKTIEKYKNHFSNLLVLKYEEFSNKPENLKNKLEEFLELEINPNNYYQTIEKRINSLGKTPSVDKFNLNFLKERYKDEIDFYNNYKS